MRRRHRLRRPLRRARRDADHPLPRRARHRRRQAGRAPRPPQRRRPTRNALCGPAAARHDRASRPAGASSGQGDLGGAAVRPRRRQCARPRHPVRAGRGREALPRGGARLAAGERDDRPRADADPRRLRAGARIDPRAAGAHRLPPAGDGRAAGCRRSVPDGALRAARARAANRAPAPAAPAPEAHRPSDHRRRDLRQGRSQPVLPASLRGGPAAARVRRALLPPPGHRRAAVDRGAAGRGVRGAARGTRLGGGRCGAVADWKRRPPGVVTPPD